MGLFHKKNKIERVLEFNKQKLNEELQNLSSKLYPLRNELSLHILLEVIHMARNIQVLDVSLYKDEKELLIHRGRLQALSDLSSYIERSMTNKPTEEKKSPQPRDAVRMRTVPHQAGAAL